VIPSSGMIGETDVQPCPLCGVVNTDNWRLVLEDGTIASGGCQDCWEKQCAESPWWQEVTGFCDKVKKEMWKQFEEFLGVVILRRPNDRS